MSKFITNNISKCQFTTVGGASITEIDTPYGKGHRYTSTEVAWQWFLVNLTTSSTSGILRIAARSNRENTAVRVQSGAENNWEELGQFKISTDWSILEISVEKNPYRIMSYYGIDVGYYIEICDNVVLSDRDSLNQLDSINVPLFKADTMPISIN